MTITKLSESKKQHRAHVQTHVHYERYHAVFYPALSPTDTRAHTVTGHHQQSRKSSQSIVRVCEREKTTLAADCVFVCGCMHGCAESRPSAPQGRE